MAGQTLPADTFSRADPKTVDSLPVALHGYNAAEAVFKEVAVDANGKLETTGYALFENFETKLLAPGADADGYDVKTTGGAFGTVTTSQRTLITNNHLTDDITFYLNTDGVNPVVLSALSTFEVSNFATTNIFIDTGAGFGASTVEVVLFG